MTDKKEDHTEQCVRCGDIGEDRRTLWMACFYAMNELKIPLNQVKIHGQVLKQIGTKPDELLIGLHGGKGDFTMPMFEEPKPNLPSAKGFESGDCNRDHNFFTMRVCKDCRASWMDAIAKWFRGYRHSTEGTGTGVFVRHNGANVELTERQVELMQSNPEALKRELSQ